MWAWRYLEERKYGKPQWDRDQGAGGIGGLWLWLSRDLPGRGHASPAAFYRLRLRLDRPGPYPLGAGATAFPRVAVKRDLRLMLLAARRAGIPLLLGSAGTAG